MDAGGGAADAGVFDFDAVVEAAVFEDGKEVEGEFAVVEHRHEAADVGVGAHGAGGFGGWGIGGGFGFDEGYFGVFAGQLAGHIGYGLAGGLLFGAAGEEFGFHGVATIFKLGGGLVELEFEAAEF